MRFLLALIWRHRGAVALGLATLLVVDAVQVVLPRVLGAAIDALGSGHPGSVPSLALAIAGIAVVMAALRFFWRWLLIGAARRIRRELRAALHARLLAQEPAFFAVTPTGELMALATNDVDAVGEACGFGVLALFDSAFLAVMAVAAMLMISPTLTLWVLVPLPPLALFVLLAGRAIHRRFERVQERFGGLTESVREAVAGARAIKLAAREPDFDRHLAAATEAYRAENQRLIGLSASFDPVIAGLAALATAGALWFVGSAAIGGTVSVGDFVAFSAYLALLAWPMEAIGWTINLVQRGLASLARIRRVLDRDPAFGDDAAGLPFPAQPALACRGLGFAYPGAPVTARPALADIGFALPAGGVLGIIGPAGSGKSTLAALLARVLDPPPGTVSVGDADVRAIRLAELRRGLAMVPQDPYLFAMSVRDNLAFARPEATDDEVRAAARLACLHDDVERFPQGYATLVGERGVTLSGGQRQRVAIARALLADPRILILDDCLSAVDATTEATLLANLRVFMRGRTCVVISHRIAAVRDAGEILVLDQGRVVERGDHARLAAAGGLYARLDELQRAYDETRGAVDA